MNKIFDNTIIFYCFSFNMGGTETLILRLLEFYGKTNNRVILLTKNKIESGIANDAKRIDFEHYTYDDIKKEFISDNSSLMFSKCEEPLVITQFLPEFLKCFILLNNSKYGVKFRHTIYIVHPHSTYYGPKQIKGLAKKMILIFLKRHALVFMDEVCVESCRHFYQLNRNEEFKIIRLPVFINDEVKPQKRNEIFNILSITRFEFPFKSYILGLIKSFSQLLISNPSMRLTVVGHGNGKAEISDLLLTMPKEVSSKISVLSDVPYFKIKDYILLSDVYVGMGTTVLDAANLNKIVITAVAYQNSNLAVGYFHENYFAIGEIFDPNKFYPTFDTLIEQLVNVNESEFLRLGAESKSVLDRHYNIENLGLELLKETGSRFTTIQRLYIQLLCYLHLLSLWIIEKKVKKLWTL